MKAFGPPKIKFHAGAYKCHFGNFPERAGMAVSTGPQKGLIRFQKIFSFGVHELLECLDTMAKTELLYLKNLGHR
jgi:hypothetical protein